MEEKNILKNKTYLYMTEFFAGMSVMAVELGASRLMAPYFSSSQIVWTIIISTIMIAMALGNIFGGRWADKDPDPGRLYRRILIAAVWIAAIPFLGKYVILGITGLLVVTINQNFLIIAAFAAAMIIFVYPCFLLGTCTPSLARYCVDNVDDSGKTVGKLGAFNTVGSIIGTFLPTFVTIPAVGTAVTFLIFSGILLALSLIYFISTGFGGTSKKDGKEKGSDADGQGTEHKDTDSKDTDSQYIENKDTDSKDTDSQYIENKDTESRESGGRDIKAGTDETVPKKKKTRRAKAPDYKRACAVACIIFLICAVFGHNDSFAFWEHDLTYEGESIYNYLQVRENDSEVILSTNVLFGVQSVMMKTDSLTGMYYDYAMAAPVMAGIADGSASDGSSEGQEDTDASESGNPRMLILGMGTGTFARQCSRYFGEMEVNGVEIDEKITDLARRYFDEPESADVTTYDGRAYLDADDTKYDVIMVDAYQDITIPFQMSSVEFFTSVKNHLKENGVMVVNMNMRTRSPEGINTYLEDTIASVFPYVQTVDVQGNTNCELFATTREVTSEEFAEQVLKITNADLRGMMMNVSANLVTYEGGDHILTDDKAPVELLGMRAIDEIISDEIGYYKEIFREQGLAGLLNAM